MDLYRQLVVDQMRRIIASGGAKRRKPKRRAGMSLVDNFALDPYRARGLRVGGKKKRKGGLPVGGKKKKRTGAKKSKMQSPWMKHLLAFKRKHPRMSLGDCMQGASKSYRG